MTVREYAGAAASTQLLAAITNSATSFTVASGGGAGYPAGTTGPFVVCLDMGNAGEEKVLCSARSGDTFTVATRGYDDTTATSHGINARVDHVATATDLREMNAHVNDATRDDHTQYAKRGQGLAANVGAASRAGRLYIATDTEDLYADDGTAVHRYPSKATADGAYVPQPGSPSATFLVRRNAANTGFDYVDPATLGSTTLFARKTTTESRTSSTTFANDADLVVAVAASTTYEVSAMIVYDGPAAADFKFSFNVPTSAVLLGSFVAEGQSAALTTDVQVQQMTRIVGNGNNTAGTDGSNSLTAQIKGLLRVAGTAGNFQFQWAQLASDPGATRVLLDSYMTLRKVA